jgi:small ligand-binding sensory domain FIST
MLALSDAGGSATVVEVVVVVVVVVSLICSKGWFRRLLLPTLDSAFPAVLEPSTIIGCIAGASYGESKPLFVEDAVVVAVAVRNEYSSAYRSTR